MNASVGVSASTHPLEASEAPLPAGGSITSYEHFEILQRPDGTRWQLGSGAMGTTYKALDTRLRCAVALKVIRPEILERNAGAHARFLREARTAASVHHPNIAAVFHLGELADGQAFYAMEFVDGENLAERIARCGPLSVPVALEITLQITRALIAAAEADLIHRDLKPANLMLTVAGIAACESWADDRMGRHSEGAASHPPFVKVVDFGLARTVKRGADLPLTIDGEFVGTPQFASPEQFGYDTESIDTRSDIFSLGCTLWFMLMGKAPFSGHSLEEIQRSKSRALPVKVLRAAAVPEPVVNLLKTMLARDPDQRSQTPVALVRAILQCRQALPTSYGPPPDHPPRPSDDDLGQSTAAGRGRAFMWVGWMAASLLLLVGAWAIVGAVPRIPAWFRPERWASFPEAPERSVAVLPFVNLSDDQGNAYFTAGVQDSILTRLAKLASLKVTSNTSTRSYGDKPTNVAEVARQLGVTYLLEGSVQKAGGKVRINVQLVRAATAEHVWAENYDRSVNDLFSVESEVAQAVAERLHVKLNGQEQRTLASTPTANPRAYDSYLRGLAFMLRPYTRLQDSTDAVSSFQEAVRLDPDFALAWAWLARSAAFTYLRQYYDPRSDMAAIARAAARRALDLQADLGEAVLAQGYVRYYCDRDYPGAAVSFDEAHRLMPNDSKALEAHASVSRRQGHWKRSLRDLAQALVVNPHDPSLILKIAEGNADLRLFDDALKYYGLGHDLVPDNDDAWFQMADIYQARGDLPAAAALLARTRLVPSDGPHEKQLEQWLYERRYQAGIEALRQLLARTDLTPDDRTRAKAHLAWFEEYAGDTTAARQTWTEVREALEPAYRDDTRDTLRFAWLAFARASLGDHAGAVAVARNLHRNVAAGGNLIEAPGVEEILARVLVRTGQLDEAAATLETLLTKPYIGMLNASHPLTRASLRLDPEWDPLRREKRFEKLFSGPEPPTRFE